MSQIACSSFSEDCSLLNACQCSIFPGAIKFPCVSGARRGVKRNREQEGIGGNAVLPQQWIYEAPHGLAKPGHFAALKALIQSLCPRHKVPDSCDKHFHDITSHDYLIGACLRFESAILRQNWLSLHACFGNGELCVHKVEVGGHLCLLIPNHVLMRFLRCYDNLPLNWETFFDTSLRMSPSQVLNHAQHRWHSCGMHKRAVMLEGVVKKLEDVQYLELWQSRCPKADRQEKILQLVLDLGVELRRLFAAGSRLQKVKRRRFSIEDEAVDAEEDVMEDNQLDEDCVLLDSIVLMFWFRFPALLYRLMLCFCYTDFVFASCVLEPEDVDPFGVRDADIALTSSNVLLNDLVKKADTRARGTFRGVIVNGAAYNASSMARPDSFEAEVPCVILGRAVAMQLQIREPYAAENHDTVLLNGPYRYPGAVSVEYWEKGNPVLHHLKPGEFTCMSEVKAFVQTHQVHAVHSHIRTGHMVSTLRSPIETETSLGTMRVQVLPWGFMIGLPPQYCDGLGADFDGDQVVLWRPLCTLSQIVMRSMSWSSSRLVFQADGECTAKVMGTARMGLEIFRRLLDADEDSPGRIRFSARALASLLGELSFCLRQEEKRSIGKQVHGTGFRPRHILQLIHNHTGSKSQHGCITYEGRLICKGSTFLPSAMTWTPSNSDVRWTQLALRLFFLDACRERHCTVFGRYQRCSTRAARLRFQHIESSEVFEVADDLVYTSEESNVGTALSFSTERVVESVDDCVVPRAASGEFTGCSFPFLGQKPNITREQLSEVCKYTPEMVVLSSGVAIHNWMQHTQWFLRHMRCSSRDQNIRATWLRKIWRRGVCEKQCKQHLLRPLHPGALLAVLATLRGSDVHAVFCTAKNILLFHLCVVRLHGVLLLQKPKFSFEEMSKLYHHQVRAEAGEVFTHCSQRPLRSKYLLDSAFLHRLQSQGGGCTPWLYEAARLGQGVVRLLHIQPDIRSIYPSPWLERVQWAVQRILQRADRTDGRSSLHGIRRQYLMLVTRLQRTLARWWMSEPLDTSDAAEVLASLRDALFRPNGGKCRFQEVVDRLECKRTSWTRTVPGLEHHLVGDQANPHILGFGDIAEELSRSSDAGYRLLGMFADTPKGPSLAIRGADPHNPPGSTRRGGAGSLAFPRDPSIVWATSTHYLGELHDKSWVAKIGAVRQAVCSLTASFVQDSMGNKYTMSSHFRGCFHCGRYISPNVSKCRCGWQKPTTEVQTCSRCNGSNFLSSNCCSRESCRCLLFRGQMLRVVQFAHERREWESLTRMHRNRLSAELPVSPRVPYIRPVRIQSVQAIMQGGRCSAVPNVPFGPMVFLWDSLEHHISQPGPNFDFLPQARYTARHARQTLNGQHIPIVAASVATRIGDVWSSRLVLDGLQLRAPEEFPQTLNMWCSVCSSVEQHRYVIFNVPPRAMRRKHCLECGLDSASSISEDPAQMSKCRVCCLRTAHNYFWDQVPADIVHEWNCERCSIQGFPAGRSRQARRHIYKYQGRCSTCSTRSELHELPTLPTDDCWHYCVMCGVVRAFREVHATTELRSDVFSSVCVPDIDSNSNWNVPATVRVGLRIDLDILKLASLGYTQRSRLILAHRLAKAGRCLCRLLAWNVISAAPGIAPNLPVASYFLYREDSQHTAIFDVLQLVRSYVFGVRGLVLENMGRADKLVVDHARARDMPSIQRLAAQIPLKRVENDRRTCFRTHGIWATAFGTSTAFGDAEVNAALNCHGWPMSIIAQSSYIDILPSESQGCAPPNVLGLSAGSLFGLPMFSSFSLTMVRTRVGYPVLNPDPTDYNELTLPTLDCIECLCQEIADPVMLAMSISEMHRVLWIRAEHIKANEPGVSDAVNQATEELRMGKIDYLEVLRPAFKPRAKWTSVPVDIMSLPEIPELE